MKVQHIAFIMDGNRRWAKSKGLPTLTGHYKGYKRIEPLVIHAQKLGIKYLTFWAFSTENWQRDKKEVTYLMELFRRVLKSSALQRLITNGCRIIILGDISPFPQDIQKNIRKLEADSKHNTKTIVNIGLNYGGRSEILRAIEQMVENEDTTKNLSEEIFSRYLYTTDQPDPDLIIRTGGEQRLSGFLAWQGVYSELYFPEFYWPDFTIKELDKAIDVYMYRDRRFGQ